MELRTYWDILWRRKWVIAITLAATVAVVILGTLQMTPVYQASMLMRVRVAAGVSASSADYYYADRLINTYAQIATSKPMLDELDKRLGPSTPSSITVLPIANTELIQVTVEDPDPSLAAVAANTLAEIFVAKSNDLLTGGGRTASQILADQLAQVEDELEGAQAEYERLVALAPEDTQQLEEASRTIGVKRGVYASLLEEYETARTTEQMRSDALSVIEPASTPIRPIKPNKALNIVLGCVVGLVGGVGLAFLFEHLDTRLHTVEQIEEATALPALGRIPIMRKESHHVFLDGGSPQREAYRRLRTSLYAMARQGALQTLLVTSTTPHEGKSTVVTNLAVAMAQAGRRVLAVDGDLRQPTLHTSFHLPNRIGLTSILAGELELREAVQEIDILRVSVLTSGPLQHNPAELLGSRQMRTLLEEMAQRFDMVLIDSPALLPVTDAAVIAPMVDGVLLVVRRAQAEREAVRSACRELTEMGGHLVGLVVTRTDESRSRYRDYQYYRLPDYAPRRDPLTRIDGISPVYEKALNALGIVTFAQLAEQDPVALSERMGVQITDTRIRCDRWIEQAQNLRLQKNNGQPSADENSSKPGS
jgi:succinoglycan biosynthesis transport protein ExoP